MIPYLASPVTVNWGSPALQLRLQPCFSRLDPSRSSRRRRPCGWDTLAENGVMFLNYGTGEPLLRRDLFPLTEYAVGRAEGDDEQQRVADRRGGRAPIREAGFHSVGISIDSAVPAAHGRFRACRGASTRRSGRPGCSGRREFPHVSSVICKVNHRTFRAGGAGEGAGAHTIDLHNFKCSAWAG